MTEWKELTGIGRACNYSASSITHNFTCSQLWFVLVVGFLRWSIPFAHQHYYFKVAPILQGSIDWFVRFWIQSHAPLQTRIFIFCHQKCRMILAILEYMTAKYYAPGIREYSNNWIVITVFMQAWSSSLQTDNDLPSFDNCIQSTGGTKTLPVQERALARWSYPVLSIFLSGLGPFAASDRE